MAENGATSTEIIGHYYSGTTVEDVASVTTGDPWLQADDALRIGLDEDATSVTFRPLAPVTLCIHSYTTDCPQERDVAADQQVVIEDTGDGCTAAIDGEITHGPSSCAFSVATAAN